MSTELNVSFAFLTGIMGAFHCLGMCIGVNGAFHAGRQRRPKLFDIAAFHGMRIAVYTVLGVSGAALGQVVVQSGDTLSHLSARYHVPVSVLRTANDLDGDFLRVGQKLRLPRDDQLQADPLYAQAAAELQQLQSGLIATQRVTHKVRPGESLSVIARRYRVSVNDLQRWNNISDPRKLRAGKTITVYASQAAPGPATSGTTKYMVRRGDSLWSIARKYDVRVKDLKSWNDLGTSMLQPGQSLRIVR